MKLAHFLFGLSVSASTLASSAFADALSVPSDVNSSDLSKMVLTEMSRDPEKLFALTMGVIKEKKNQAAAVETAVNRFFMTQVAGMKKAVWLGDAKSASTGFVFVDWSEPFAPAFLKAVETFADKAGVRILVLPGWVDERQRHSAVLASWLIENGQFVDFYSKVSADPKVYSGNIESFVDDKISMAGAENSYETVSVVEAAHLYLVAKGVKHPTYLTLNGKAYVGDIESPDEMLEFYLIRH
jgi:hypothetical protein